MIAMTYRVYSGPRGSESIRPLQKDHLLFKEFGVLDEAISWAHHVNEVTEHADRIEWKKQSDCDVERAQCRNQNAVERR